MEGTPVKIGRTEYVVPEATLDTAEVLATKLEALRDSGGTPMKVADIIATALRENYPEVTAADIARSVKLKGSAAVLSAVLSAAGLRAEEGQGTGEGPSP